jgi:hypothetical protein
VAASRRGRVGPHGKIGGCQLSVAKAHAALLEHQPAQPLDRGALKALGILLQDQAHDLKCVPSGTAGSSAAAARTAARSPCNKARRLSRVVGCRRRVPGGAVR